MGQAVEHGSDVAGANDTDANALFIGADQDGNPKLIVMVRRKVYVREKDGTS